MKPKIYTVSVKIEGVDLEVDYTGLGEDCVVESIHLPQSSVNLYNVLDSDVQYSAEQAAYTDSDERLADDTRFTGRDKDMHYDPDQIPPSDADPGL